MQQLHLVGFTTDLEGLIFSARKGAKSGGYLVVLDDKLRAAIEDALRLRDGQAPLGDSVDEEGVVVTRPRRPKPQSTLSPREIQARLRTGSTIAEVAEEAGVGEEWVGRFAAPILAEQAQVVARARRLTFVKPRLGESAQPLGVAVRWNLADKSVRMLDDDYDAAWDAYNLQGTSWVVRFQYASRQKRHVAEWEVDLREEQLFARNRTASELAYVDPARRRRRPPVLEPSPRETPARPVDHGRGVRAADDAVVEVASVATVPVVARAGRNATRAGAGRAQTARPAARGAAKQSTGSAGRRNAPAGGATGKTAATRAAASKATPTRGAGGRAGGAAAGKTGRAATTKKAAAKKASAAKTGGKRGRTTSRASDASGPDPAATVARLEEPVRASHLARPPSPMPMSRRAATQPFPGRPVPGPIAPARPAPRPTSGGRDPAPERSRPASAPRDDAESWGDGDAGAVAARRAAARPDTGRAQGVAPRPPVAVTEGVRVLDATTGNGDIARAAAPPARTARAAAPPARTARVAASPRADAGAAGPARRVASSAAPGPAGDPSRARRAAVIDAGPPAGDPIPVAAAPAEREPRRAAGPRGGGGAPSPEQRLARRLAAGAAGTPARSAPRPSGQTPPPNDEAVWHGPGSGEPAPPVRIRADLAAGTIRPQETPAPPAPPASRTRERPLRARPEGRRERPLRAR